MSETSDDLTREDVRRLRLVTELDLNWPDGTTAQLDALTPVVQEMLADAWDQGYAAMFPVDADPNVPNPYRTKETSA